MRLTCCLLIAAFVSTTTPLVAQGKKGKRARISSQAQVYGSVQPATDARVARLLVNPLGEVDGVLLDNGTIVTFPAHMGDELASTVKPGDLVAVKGYPESATQIKGYVITSTSSNRTVTTLPKPRGGIRMPKFLRNLGLKNMTAQGEVRHLRFGKGVTNGVILADGTIVRFKREALYRFGALMQVGQRITATGYGSENQFGRALEATALGPEGQPAQPLYSK